MIRSAAVAAIALTIVSIAAGAAAPAFEPIDPMVSPDGQRLAWVEGSTWRVWEAAADGSDAQPASTGAGFAANGISQIAWTSRGFVVDSNFSLFLVSSAGKQTRIAPADFDFAVGGTRVASGAGSCGNCEERLQVTDLRTRRTIRLGPAGAANGLPSLSADGRIIVWSGPGGVWIGTTAAGRARLLVPGGTYGSISPNGRSVAYLVVDGGRSTLRVVPAEGGPSRLLGRFPHVARLSWSPDGRTIAFAPERLVTVGVATGRVLRSPTSIGRVVGFAWSPDSHLAYVSARPLADERGGDNCTSIWRLEAATLRGRVVVHGGCP